MLEVKPLFQGAVLKQGDKTPLTYELLAKNGQALNISGKTAEVVFLTPDYKKKASVDTATVSPNNTVTFNIDGNLPNGKYYIEFVVGTGNNQQIFPSANRSYFEVTPSSLEDDVNVIKMVGFEELSETIIERVKVDIDELLNQVEQSETTRQSTFESNENSRQTAFEQAETNREEAELTRTQAEAQRQSTFESNEQNREVTFTQAELDRQAQEEARETAEGERGTAEAQRKADHANRSAEFDGKADKVVLKNLVENGNFSEGTKGWMNGAYQTEFEVIDGVAKTINFVVNNRSFIQTLPEQPNIGDMIYVSINTRVDHPDKLRDMSILSDFSGVNENTIAGPITNVTREFMRFSGTVRHKGVFTLRVIHNFNETGEYPTYLKDVVAINLTQTFGAGNEPTKEEMDELIKVIGYIDEEYALNNKEMLIWTLALIRRNKNAIITLGGTF